MEPEIPRRKIHIAFRTAVQLRALADEVSAGRLVRLTVACQGGRHRSTAVAEEVGRRVWEAWGGEYGVDIEHHHIDHPVLPPSPPDRPANRTDAPGTR
ncbi:hypothetical protein ACFUJU_30965 [Streptomyces sp. NPDC057235]|uniref:RapZ C-terminal domain-containing protein n=1 Tax=Streptomyces sp. NPDC057235 TaxID=3346058 RepID=UPI003629E078